MGERFRSLVDATIVYPDGVPSFWDFMSGRVPRIVVRGAAAHPEGFAASDYATDPAFRRQFQRWLTALWEEKDREFEQLLQRSRWPQAPIVWMGRSSIGQEVEFGARLRGEERGHRGVRFLPEHRLHVAALHASRLAQARGEVRLQRGDGHASVLVG